MQEAKALPNYSFFDLLHGYVYGRWLYLYVSIATGEHLLAQFFLPLAGLLKRVFASHTTSSGGNGEARRITFADTYHGKVVPLDAAVNLVKVNKDISISAPEHVIPYAVARDIVLKNPGHIVALQCPCRTARKNPCKPLDVCLVVGEPFASFTVDHHPRRSRRVTQVEAVEILRAEEERGHVHHAFFKDAMLGRFYAICNCCSCCCGAMQAYRNGTPMLASSGYVATVNRERCVGCETCSKYCQFQAVTVVDCLKTIDEAKCMGCGVCVSHCKQDAISLAEHPSRGVPLDIEELMASATQSN